MTSSWAHDLEVWDISTGTNIARVGSIPAHGNEVWALAESRDGKALATGCKDSTIKVWAADAFLERARPVDQIEAKDNDWFGFTEGSERIVTLTAKASLSFWDAKTLVKLGSQPVPAIQSSALSPDGSQLAAVLTNGAVQIWKVSLGQTTPLLAKEILSPRPDVSDPLANWSPSGKYLVARVGDVYVWNAATTQLARRLSLSDQPDPLALSPDGRMLGVGMAAKGSHGFGRWLGHKGAFNSMIELWDVPSGKRIGSWSAHREWINDLAFSPDGKILASANMDNTAKLWHVPSGKLKANLTSHTLAVFGVAFSPDGRTLATAGGDAVKLWNVETGQELLTVIRPGADRVLFSPDGLSLVLRGDYGLTVRHAPSLAEIEVAEAANAQTR